MIPLFNVLSALDATTTNVLLVGGLLAIYAAAALWGPKEPD